MLTTNRRKWTLPVIAAAVFFSAASLANSPAAQGEYLSKIGNCAGCHTARGGQPMAGGKPIASPYGNFVSPNITPGGIGDWSADEFSAALRSGLRPDGSSLYPVCPFPSFSHTSRQDSDAIFAYLQSLPASNLPSQPQALRFPYNQRWLLKPWRALYFDGGEYQADSRQSALWNRGAYLVNGLGHCAECHNQRNLLGATVTTEQQSGAMVDGWHAPSLHGEAGSQPYAVTDTANWLRSGASDKRIASGPMAQVVYNSLQHLSENDALAMATYLQSLPVQAAKPIRQFFRVPQAEANQQFTLGSTIYQRSCADCHGNNGEGSEAAIGLVGNPTVTASEPVNLIKILLHGGYAPATRLNPRPYGMPPYQGVLSRREMAAVLTFIRGSWGNNSTAVSAENID